MNSSSLLHSNSEVNEYPTSPSSLALESKFKRNVQAKGLIKPSFPSLSTSTSSSLHMPSSQNQMCYDPSLPTDMDLGNEKSSFYHSNITFLHDEKILEIQQILEECEKEGDGTSKEMNISFTKIENNILKETGSKLHCMTDCKVLTTPFSSNQPYPSNEPAFLSSSISEQYKPSPLPFFETTLSSKSYWCPEEHLLEVLRFNLNALTTAFPDSFQLDSSPLLSPSTSAAPPTRPSPTFPLSILHEKHELDISSNSTSVSLSPPCSLEEFLTPPLPFSPEALPDLLSPSKSQRCVSVPPLNISSCVSFSTLDPHPCSNEKDTFAYHKASTSSTCSPSRSPPSTFNAWMPNTVTSPMSSPSFLSFVPPADPSLSPPFPSHSFFLTPSELNPGVSPHKPVQNFTGSMDLHTSPKDLQNGGPVPGASKLLSFYSTPIKHETEPFSVQKKESTPSRQIHSPSIYSSSYVSSVPATFNSLVNGWMDESLLVHKKKLHHELLEPVPPTPLDDVIENLQSQLRFHPFFSSTSTTQMTSSLPTQQGEDKNPSNFHINPSPYCIKDFPSMVPLKDETVTPLLSNSWVPLNPTSEPLRSSSPKNETQVSSTDLPSSFSKSYDTHVHLSRRTTSMTPPPLPPLLKDAPTKVGLVTPFPSPSPCQVPKEKEKHNIDPNLLHVLLSALPQASIQQELLTPWMNVTELKLSGCDLRSCEGLASVTPCLQVCDLSYNQLRTLTGLPLTLMDLNVSQNPLVSSTSFSPFVHLESLNVSHTGWTHGEGFFGLLHLRELYLDHNAIVHLNSVDHPPWPKLPSLTYLSLSHNALVEFTLDPTQVPKLKVLNVSHNELSQVGHEPPGLSLFLQLTSLNLASNAFLQFPYSHPGLQVLDVSDNLIQEFDVSGFPNLKQLYLQRNQLHTLHGGGRMGKVQLDVLDVSDQSSLFFPSTTLTSFSSTTTTTTVTDTPTRTPTPTMTSLFSISTLPEMFPRELYLKGHVSLPFHSSFVFYSVVHLDLARCQLNQLPTFFSSLFPSLLHLNVSQNPLTALPDLTSLRYLTQLNCSSTHLTSLVTFFSQCPCTQLTHLHLEFTPLTQGFMEDKVNLEATPYDPTLVFFGPDLSRPWTPSLLRKDDRPNLELPPTKENLELLWYRCQVLAQCPHLTFLDDFPVDRSLYLKYHALLRPIMHPNEHEAT